MRERNAGQKHPLEIALHHRRQPVEPDGIHQDERFGGPQALDVRFDLARVDPGVDVVGELLARHDRIEPLGVEIEIVDVMSARAQGFDDAQMERSDEARLQRMRVDDENAQFSRLQPARRADPELAGCAPRR